jgi:hypothetical protein
VRGRHAPLAALSVPERRRDAALVADYYVSSGKNGPLKVRRRREDAHRRPTSPEPPRQKLSDFYGSGAFPIGYPEQWDRIQGRSGHRHLAARDAFGHLQRASACE